MTTHCPVCKEPIDVCPYGGDCGEIDMIARERQREINADIDVSGMADCADCHSALAEPDERYCYSCTHASDPNWTKACENCGETPIVPVTGLCGPCTFGEADTAGGNW